METRPFLQQDFYSVRNCMNEKILWKKYIYSVLITIFHQNLIYRYSVTNMWHNKLYVYVPVFGFLSVGDRAIQCLS